jgi:hypothetical protein
VVLQVYPYTPPTVKRQQNRVTARMHGSVLGAMKVCLDCRERSTSDKKLTCTHKESTHATRRSDAHSQCKPCGSNSSGTRSGWTACDPLPLNQCFWRERKREKERERERVLVWCVVVMLVVVMHRAFPHTPRLRRDSSSRRFTLSCCSGFTIGRLVGNARVCLTVCVYECMCV